MISQLITQFNELSESIESAVLTDDHSVITALDEQISNVWNQVLNYEPSDEKKSYLLIEFLLNHLVEKRDVRESEKHAKHRILTILNDHFEQ